MYPTRNLKYNEESFNYYILLSPSAGAGVQRWLKFSKYLPKFNENRHHTPENPYFHIKDPDLNKDVSSELVVWKKHLGALLFKKIKYLDNH